MTSHNEILKSATALHNPEMIQALAAQSPRGPNLERIRGARAQPSPKTAAKVSVPRFGVLTFSAGQKIIQIEIGIEIS